MKKLLNTLYVLSEDVYLSLDGETVVINRENEVIKQYPLHTLEHILYFGYRGASPALMGACGERGVRLAFFTPSGRYLCSACGENRGNVLLRKKQYRISDSEDESVLIARSMIFGKLYNSRWVLDRATRDHALQVDVEKLKNASAFISDQQSDAYQCGRLDILRGIEGVCAERYFSVLDELILQNKNTFYFKGRNRRPPVDPVNALLSFMYTILSNRCAAALEGVGLDPYVGFMHRDRPGRISLALDLTEELRSVMVDRFVLTLINNRIIKAKDFEVKENGAVLITKNAKQNILAEWQERLKDIITHPFIDEKLEWGLIPYVQAQLLARYLRGDLDEYPPFLWK